MKNSKRVYLVVSLLLVAGYGWIAINLLYGHTAHQHISLCLFKNITGMACPACGSTRAIVDLIHLNITASIHHNPLGILLSLGLITLPFWLIFDFFFSKKSFYEAFVKIETIINANKRIQVVLITFVILNWGWGIYKNI